jgi:hypothetical protein
MRQDCQDGYFLIILIGNDLIPIRKYPELIHYGHYNHAKMVIPCICAMDPVSGSGILLKPTSSINILIKSIDQDPKGGSHDARK